MNDKDLKRTPKLRAEPTFDAEAYRIRSFERFGLYDVARISAGLRRLASATSRATHDNVA